MSMEPSAFGTRPERELTLERSMGLLTMYPTTSVMVSDQKASLGGSCPSGKCRTYSCWPESRRPALSTVVVQYAASCTTLTAGRFLAQAARRRMPLPGWPHLKVVLHPLTVVVMAFTITFIMICAVRNASTPPTMIPCMMCEPASQVRIFIILRVTPTSCEHL